MRLLIIEDNQELAYAMKEQLIPNGFSIDVALTGEVGQEKAYVNEYDCILLDLNLPDVDGISLLQELRKEKINTPVIIVSARDKTQERILGIDLGADDYLIKPFKITELRARIQAVVRRYYGRTNVNIVIGSLLINPLSRKVYVAEQEIMLTVKEFDILEYIASVHPKVVSSEEMIEHVYDEYFDPFSSVLRVHMARLKSKLQQAYGNEVLITVRGKGYYLCIE